MDCSIPRGSRYLIIKELGLKDHDHYGFWTYILNNLESGPSGICIVPKKSDKREPPNTDPLVDLPDCIQQTEDFIVLFELVYPKQAQLNFGEQRVRTRQ